MTNIMCALFIMRYDLIFLSSEPIRQYFCYSIKNTPIRPSWLQIGFVSVFALSLAYLLIWYKNIEVLNQKKLPAKQNRFLLIHHKTKPPIIHILYYNFPLRVNPFAAARYSLPLPQQKALIFHIRQKNIAPGERW